MGGGGGGGGHRAEIYNQEGYRGKRKGGKPAGILKWCRPEKRAKC